MTRTIPITVVETPEFLATTRKLLDEAERAALVDHLAYNPSAGTVIPGTGGIRKLRWGLEGRGKRSGARVIYFFHNLEMPLFLLTAYAKNERDDLNHADYASFQQLTKMLVESYRIRRLKP
ncbi:type II toxin-antitoxin system RelE/ParE family toxin [Acidicapsa acidisoli]|uniref:type II toxin-antitoxin system RelE/ParE family toxin n=1 Tax=Acidicapsa acidisoli TaxID=1615681 RepID=UPI0021E0C8BA|nr:type II toxin-antitoxin system RelE/ParE family toxin [Acidicapsa acidisoli]